MRVAPAGIGQIPRELEMLVWAMTKGAIKTCLEVERRNYRVSEVKVLNGHGFNFNVAPSLFQIICPLI